MSDIVLETGPASDAGRSRLAVLLPTAAVFAGAIVIRIFSHLNADTSWLLTLGEKMASGARPYVDFLEVNPPASILLYYPAILSGHALGVAPEVVVNVLVFAAVAASLGFCASVLAKARLIEDRHFAMLGAVVAFALLILPVYVFAERERIALAAISPMLCVYAARAMNQRVDTRTALIAGLAGGAAVIIKPYFALALALPFALVFWRQHGVRTRVRATFSVENLASVVLAMLYALFVFWRFPEFLHNEMPLLTAVYANAKRPLPALLTGPSCLLSVIGMLCVVRLTGRRIFEPVIAIPMLAALGFFIVAIIQGKGWAYHSYPAVALSVVVSGALIVTNPSAWRSVSTVLIFVIFAAASALWFSRSDEKPALLRALQQENLQNPGVLTISEEIGLGHPLTRLLHGHWAGTACSMWVTGDAHYLLARGGLDAKTTQALQHYEAADRALIAHDINHNRPDVVLIANKEWHDMAMSDSGIHAALGAYRNAQTVDGVEIWLRNKSGK